MLVRVDERCPAIRREDLAKIMKVELLPRVLEVDYDLELEGLGVELTSPVLVYLGGGGS